MKGVAVCSIEGDHFIRSKLLDYIAETALRVKFDNVLPPARLRSKLIQYESRINRCLTGPERDKLYPTTGIVSSKTMDLTLMVKVLRNTGVIRKPSSGFDRKPSKTEISEGADVARLKYIRNHFSHTTVRELNGQEYEEITQTLIEVIRRFCGSLFDDDIRSIMEESLDCRAGTLCYHVLEGIALAPSSFNKTVIKPTKDSVVQLYEHQPLHYAIYGGPVVAYFMKDIFEVPSIEELIYYLRETKNEYSYVSQSIAEVILYQPKKSVKIEGNVTFPVPISDSISALNLDLPGLNNLQYRHVQRTSVLWSRPYFTDSLYANNTLLEAQLYRTQFCENPSIEYCRWLQQVNIPSYPNYAENNDCRTEQAFATDRYDVNTIIPCASQSDSNTNDRVFIQMIEKIDVVERENKEQNVYLYLFLLLGITVFIQSTRDYFEPRFKDFWYKIFERPKNTRVPRSSCVLP